MIDTGLRPIAAPAAAALAKALTAPGARYELHAIMTALGNIGPPAKDAVPRLVEMMETGQPAYRGIAAEAVLKIDPSRRDAVLKALAQQRPHGFAAMSSMFDALVERPAFAAVDCSALVLAVACGMAMAADLLGEDERISAPGAPLALVIAPTRELVVQIEENIRAYGKHLSLRMATVFGGVGETPQIRALREGTEIVVATPGRLLDLMGRRCADFSGLEFLVLDEADRMLDMGFLPSIRQIVRSLPKQRQTLLFSATYPEGIAKLSQQFMRQPQTVKVEAQHEASKIRQRWYQVRDSERLHTVSKVLNHYRPASTLAFCNTKLRCRELVAVLQAFASAAICS